MVPDVGMPVFTVKSMSSLLLVEPPIVALLDAHPAEFHVQVMRMVSPAVAENVPDALALPFVGAVRSSETICVPATNSV